MIFGFDQALSLEAKALRVNTASKDLVALELDFQLWQLLRSACATQPRAACEAFGLRQSSAETIAAAHDSKLQELASGAVLSFGIQHDQTTHEVIDTILSSPSLLGDSMTVSDFSPELAYWRAARLMALRDIHQAHGKTGIPTDLLSKLAKAADSQLARLATAAIGFGLMCSEKTVCDVLLESRPDTLTQLRLKKVQQCLTARGRTPSQNAPEPFSAMSQTGRHMVGRLMLIMGFVNRVVELETGLTYKQIIKLIAHIKADGVKINTPKSRSLKTGASLIYNYSSKIQASLLMQLYVNVGGADVYQNTNINALLRAFHVYSELREEIPGMKAARWDPYDVNAVWALIAELRRSADTGMLGYCKDCGCSYFTSTNQRTYIECPYCHVQREVGRSSSASSAPGNERCEAADGHRIGESCECLPSMSAVRSASGRLAVLGQFPFTPQHPPPSFLAGRLGSM